MKYVHGSCLDTWRQLNSIQPWLDTCRQCLSLYSYHLVWWLQLLFLRHLVTLVVQCSVCVALYQFHGVLVVAMVDPLSNTLYDLYWIHYWIQLM